MAKKPAKNAPLPIVSTHVGSEWDGSYTSTAEGLDAETTYFVQVGEGGGCCSGFALGSDELGRLEFTRALRGNGHYMQELWLYGPTRPSPSGKTRKKVLARGSFEVE